MAGPNEQETKIDQKNKKEKLFQKIIQQQERLRKANTVLAAITAGIEQLKKGGMLPKEAVLLDLIVQSEIRSFKECLNNLDYSLDQFLDLMDPSKESSPNLDLDTEKKKQDIANKEASVAGKDNGGNPVDSGDIKQD